MDKQITMRDTFWNRIYELAKVDKDIIVIAADMGAPALDKFRIDLPGQFVNAGIAEQNAMLVATGLALKGKKVYVYAIAPFITMRCYEQIRIYPAGMNLPITIVGVGAGVCYEESGPTHHAVEDISILRILPNMKIYSACDNNMTKMFADLTYSEKSPNYVRLDRIILPNIYPEGSDFSEGIGVLRPVSGITVMATGCMIKTALEVSDILKKKGVNIGVLDAYNIPVDAEKFINMTKHVKILYTLEEHTLPGGFGSQICEIVVDHDLDMKVRRLGFDFSRNYCYTYGGRQYIHPEYGLDAANICAKIEKDL
ncbi:MAG: 1-deoxy-D-xylulose-5-phosphate synthase [Lachnospiraceae bacterium]|nr:1-deoxy-D-xylulose-5-phosphate synthase [Lachnospiraceae bacterium]